MTIERIAGAGWLVLLGGGEFSFGETEEVDRAWLAKLPAEGKIGFLPTASGSSDYGLHFAAYADQVLGREVETIPVYRGRDAIRGKNAERVKAVAAVYLGGGVTDHLLEVLPGTPVGEALQTQLVEGGVVVAMAAAAQVLGKAARSLITRAVVPGLAWLPKAVLEPNFEPAHDRRLRQLAATPGVNHGLGLPAGSALLLGPNGEVETVGPVFRLRHADDDLVLL
jgi:cyanophycinase-like exopeptidase